MKTKFERLATRDKLITIAEVICQNEIVMRGNDYNIAWKKAVGEVGLRLEVTLDRPLTHPKSRLAWGKMSTIEDGSEAEIVVDPRKSPAAFEDPYVEDVILAPFVEYAQSRNMLALNRREVIDGWPGMAAAVLL